MQKGEFGDEEMPHKKFVYQYEYNNGTVGKRGFKKSGKNGFKVLLLKEINRLRDEEGIRTPKVGVYIHGYNNDYQDSIDELADLEERLQAANGTPLILIGFSWPSSGRVTHYLSDREEARDSVGAFSRFLLDINSFVSEQKRICFSTTFCIVHSMGNYLLRKGMEYLSDELGTPNGRLIFNETLMLAPDISSKDIEKEHKASYISNFSRRVHVYYSKSDRVVKASSVKRFGSNRLGRHGANNYDNLPENVVLIDSANFANQSEVEILSKKLNKSVSVHSSYKYHDSILADMLQVISSIDRDLIVNREPYFEDGEPHNHYKLM
jgi:esterase/lipase superfamily enzyme